uniref:Ubiquitin conjugating enzyme E2 G2 n=1 Tax=Canis lupus dingo TaxID=286419 RepID=A0A8C0L403_CANLU
MAGTALKRLMAEYKQLTLNPPEGIVAGPMNEENFFEWEALIMSDTVDFRFSDVSGAPSPHLRDRLQPPFEQVQSGPVTQKKACVCSC